MKTFIKALLFLAVVSVCFPAFGQLSRANKDYELGAFNLAVRSYLELLEKRPANYEAMVKLADSYRYLNQMDEARSWYEKVIRENKLEGEDLFKYAQVLMALEQYDKAKEWFLAYARVNKDDAARANQYAQSCTFAKNLAGQSSSYLVSNEFINTVSADFGPAFFGDQVLFSSSRTDILPPGSAWTGKANNQLFTARIGSNGFLEAPVAMQNQKREGMINIGPVSVSQDAKTIAYTKNNFIDGTRQIPHGGLELSLSIAQVNPSGEWAEDRPFPYNGSGFSTGYPGLAPDGNALYFASNRPDGYGGFDLYVSYRMGNTWSTPENLGPNVNTPGNEISPFFDGAALFFSSDWHQGLGGYDIFQGEQANGRWSRVINLGNLVNSSRDDYGFVFDNFRNLGYLVSNRPGGHGNEDIYKVFKSADNIELHVRNASDGTPIPFATVDFTNCGEGLFRADSRGVYTFQAVEGLNCDIVIRSDDYNDSVFKLSTLGMRQNRNYDIMLSRRGEEYVGKILNYATRMPVAGVAVSATNQSTNSTMEATTDVNGDYALALSPNSSYIIRYSRPGFRDLSRTVYSGQANDRSILGVISILPVTMDPGNIPDVIGSGDVTPKEPTEPAIASGYAVQVAALSKPGLEGFSGLTSLGQVYSKYEDGRYKVRVGVFSTKEEAGRVLNSVKSKGYKGAFITEEGGTVSDVQRKGVTDNTSNVAPTSSSPTQGRYLVQLAAYKNPQWFNGSGLEGYGTIMDGQRDGLTIKYLAYFNDIEQAKQAWQRARSLGFTTAFVVVDIGGGEYRKVYP
ncbi:MAG: carboxypeptidase regulatory-like domain-containing protein [Phaeodactylibacter sp.]|nr:carboxypeptidase regulatory-like domain-containing protein [Phaeodactylibacter sp.]